MNDTENAYCRLCAVSKPKSKLINVQTDELKRREIVDRLSRLTACISNLFNEDALPKNVCYVCVNSLNSAYDFVLAVEQAQSVLKDLLLEQIKQETNISDKSSDSEDNFVYEGPKYDIDGTVTNNEVKVEFNVKLDVKTGLLENHAENNVKTQGCMKKKLQRKTLKNCSKASPSDLDTIPLSLLKLTWKVYNWICAHCETQFTNINELKMHCIQYHKYCNAYKCIDCDTKKFCLNKFLTHVKRHRKYLKLSCYICYARFSTPHECNMHKTVHLNTKYVCKGCNMTFQDADELNCHTSAYYKTKRPREKLSAQELEDSLTCVLCKKKMKCKANLHIHLLTHTERKRDHTCDKCGKCFYNKPNLLNHLAAVHADRRPFQCEICKLAFKTKSQLNSHVIIHSSVKPYACDKCSRSFNFKARLTSHYRIHTGSLPFTCKYCDKRFRFKNLLNQHIRQHTGVKPYSCELCQRDFTNWPNYNKHMKRLHGTDMAKKRRTPNGVYPIDPTTGELIIHPETNKTKEWKKKMLANRRLGRLRKSVEVPKNLNGKESEQISNSLVS